MGIRKIGILVAVLVLCTACKQIEKTPSSKAQVEKETVLSEGVEPEAELPAFRLTNPRINFLENPIGIDTNAFYFSWEWEPLQDQENLEQAAYQIVLYKAQEMVWDSGKESSGDRVNIPYTGPTLQDATEYTYEIQCFVKKQGEQKEGVETIHGKFTTAHVENPVFAQSHFITYGKEENVDKEGLAVLCKTLSFSKENIEKVYLYASALGIYEPYLNGEPISKVAYLPGWTDYTDSLLYQTFDITNQLQEGENHFAISLGNGWWAGRNSFETYGKHQPAWIGELYIVYKDETREIIGTDDTWQYVMDTAIRRADFYDGETYDFHKPSVKDLSKATLQEGKQVVLSTLFQGTFHSFYGNGVKHREELDQSPSSAWKYDSILDTGTTYGAVKEQPCSLEQPLLLQPGETLIVDMGQNITGVPEVVFEGEDQTEVTLLFAEMLNDSGEKKRGNDGPKNSLYTANYRSAKTEVKVITDGNGRKTYQPTFFYTGFRYISVTTNQPVTIISLKGLVYTNSSDRVGYFRTNHEKINRLYENVLWSQYNNYMLVATDCPQRDERLGWTGDLNSFANTSMYNQDLFSFYEKWAYDLIDGQTGTGSIPDTLPYVKIIGAGNGGWADGAILVPLNVYRKYGNIGYLEKLYPTMSNYMDYLERQSDFSRKDKVGPGIAYGDWLGLENTEKRFLSAMWYGVDIKAMETMADILEMEEEEENYHELYLQLLQYLDTYYIQEKMAQNSFTQTELVFMLYHDLVKEEYVDELATALATSVEKNQYKLMTGFAGTPILLATLCKVGYGDLAYQVLLSEENPSWMYSLLQGATTIWERYDSYTIEKGFQDAAMNSFDHFNEGSVAQFFYEQLLGIQVDHTKDSMIRIAPIFPKEETGILQGEGSYHSIYGEISVKWEREGESIHLEVNLPAGCQAELQLEENMPEVISGHVEKNIVSN